MIDATAPSPVRRRAAAAASRRRSERVLYLIATDECGLAEAQALCASLPLCATGRMFVEVPDADFVGALDLPPRMTVTWLPRDRGGRRATAGRGELLARAAGAWASEMLCDGAGAEVWLDGDYRGVSAVHEALVERAGVRPAGIRTPARYALGARPA
jgi:NADPH-dependent ferric siderophore reductase